MTVEPPNILALTPCLTVLTARAPAPAADRPTTAAEAATETAVAVLVRSLLESASTVTSPFPLSTRLLPIEARVASGRVDVSFWLESPTGVPIGQPEVADVTLRADWEGIGLGILGGVIVVLLILGSVRMVRRRRADARHRTQGPNGSAEGEQ